MTPEQINAFLDQMKSNLDIKSDAQLARYLKVQPITIWRWRQGELDETKQILIAYLSQRNEVAV